MDSKENDSALLRDLKVINDLPDPPRTTRPKRAITQSRRTLSELPSVLQAAANSRVTRNSDFGAPARPNLPFSRAPVSRGKLALKRPLPAETDELDFDLELAQAPAPAPAPHRLKTSHRPLQYISRNDMYDNAWIDKQENAFTKWLNYELGAEDDLGAEGFGSMWASPPAKAAVEAKADPVSMRGSGRWRARFTSPKRSALCCGKWTMVNLYIYMYLCAYLLFLLDKPQAIARNRLKLHPDVNMVEDVGVRQGIVDLLFTYDPRWLVVGLETVMGRAVAPLLTTDQGKISAFMNRNLFHDDAIAATFRPTGNKSTRRAFLLAMHRSIFLRVLMTIFFLDRAKPARLLPNDPCLFRRSAPHKTSRDMVVAIAAKYLLGEGDVVRHLFYIGYAVNHVQTPLEEYNFEVKNLATDLRDGIKLTRLVERYTCEWGLSLQLRHPAQSRAQQLHNVSLALGVVQRHGVDLDAGPRAGTIAAKDVVDGHREKTFALLWSVIMHWRIPAVLDKRALRFEIRLLGEEFERKFRRKVDAESDTMYITSEHLTLLLSWCKVVCAFYGVPVRNFTNSFADGRALCYIVHHYHPSVLPADRIENSGRYLETMLKEAEEIAPPEGTMSWFIPSENIKDPVVEGRELDKKNFRLLHAKVKELGGVPLILRYQDFSTLGVPDEKVVITYVTYLCARVIHLSREIRAARRIQLTWRTHHQRRLLAERCRTIISIQACVRRFIVRQTLRRYFLVRVDAAIKIQSTYRGYLGRLVAAQRYSATVWLQTMARRALARRRFVAEKGVRAIQAQCRGVVVRKRIETLLDMVRPMQAAARGWLVRQRVGRDMIAHRAATMIQTAWRGVEARQWFLLLKAVVLVLEERRQATLLCRRDRERYEKLWWATWTVQQQWRAKLEGTRVRKWYAGVRKVVIKTQTVARGVLVRRRGGDAEGVEGFPGQEGLCSSEGGDDRDAESAESAVGNEEGEASVFDTEMGGDGDSGEVEGVHTGEEDSASVHALAVRSRVHTTELAPVRGEKAVRRAKGGDARDAEEAARAGCDEGGTEGVYSTKMGRHGHSGEVAGIRCHAADGRRVPDLSVCGDRGAGGVAKVRGAHKVPRAARGGRLRAEEAARTGCDEGGTEGVYSAKMGRHGHSGEVAGIRCHEADCRRVPDLSVCGDRDAGGVAKVRGAHKVPRAARGGRLRAEEAARTGYDEGGTGGVYDTKMGRHGHSGEVAGIRCRAADGQGIPGLSVCGGRGTDGVAKIRSTHKVPRAARGRCLRAEEAARHRHDATGQRMVHRSRVGDHGLPAAMEGPVGNARGCRVVPGDAEGGGCAPIRVPWGAMRGRTVASGDTRRHRHPDGIQDIRGTVRLRDAQGGGDLRAEEKEGAGAGPGGARGVSRVSRRCPTDPGVVARVPVAQDDQGRFRGAAERDYRRAEPGAWGDGSGAGAAVPCGRQDPVGVSDVRLSTRVRGHALGGLGCPGTMACQGCMRRGEAVVPTEMLGVHDHSGNVACVSGEEEVSQRIPRHAVGEHHDPVSLQEYDEEYCAATVIQAGARGYLTRVRIAREMALRREYLQSWFQEAYQHMCAIRIQRVFRNHVAYQAAKKHHDSIVTIQQWWRAKAVRLNFLRLRAATLFVQARAKLVFLRHTRAALIIQKRWQVVVARRRFLRICEATLLIQSVWRAHLVRRTQGPKFRAMRRNIREVNARAEEHMKLSNRTTMALDILLTSKQLSAVLKACYHLVTDLSKICCLRLIEHNVIRIIFTLIKQSNRSQPHMEVLKHAMYILRNLSRTPETSPHVFADPEGVDILVESLQSYRENERIFACAASILVTMARGGQDGTANARQMRQLPNVLKRIKAVQAFAERKFAKEFSATGTAAKASKAAAKPMTKVAKEKEREKERANRTLAALTELMERLEGRK
ncbi:LOW QUALITY PROTEIN: hypothetical protein BC936DRAFT_149745 [Jimgerdemannia flammicorona]|uniref:Calponin-homology (CH) domain-containing protein n=1 Tax=Jimgerdemannia flammicorona TaxID=994334 RepID=A0A433DKA6_9FUNG|nr:LOW QUALITY PROTEIN: hypothetical protein BC936DRAFT_149745 [Jimgerdemannia flammicorona]